VRPPNTPAEFERRQQVVRAALDGLQTDRFAPGAPDEYFWGTMRESLLDAGATATDLDDLAA
jgi:hypothetical protein